MNFTSNIKDKIQMHKETLCLKYDNNRKYKKVWVMTSTIKVCEEIKVNYVLRDRS